MLWAIYEASVGARRCATEISRLPEQSPLTLNQLLRSSASAREDSVLCEDFLRREKSKRRVAMQVEGEGWVRARNAPRERRSPGMICWLTRSLAGTSGSLPRFSTPVYVAVVRISNVLSTTRLSRPSCTTCDGQILPYRAVQATYLAIMQYVPPERCRPTLRSRGRSTAVADPFEPKSMDECMSCMQHDSGGTRLL